MKKTFLKLMTLMLCFIIIALSVFSNISAIEVKNEPEIDENMVLTARFLNMLNHSYVYGEDFNNLDTIVNNSVVALLDKKDADNESYINQSIVNSYLYDMYGFEILDFSTINDGLNYKDGFVYIIPRGYTVYKHSPSNLIQNEDGTYTFITNVNICSHDGVNEQLTCETLFVKNEKSTFGFNIVTSKI